MIPCCCNAFNILFLSLQAQTPVTGDDGTVRATSSSLHKAGKELLVSIEIEITRDFLPNESMTLVPVVSDRKINKRAPFFFSDFRGFHLGSQEYELWNRGWLWV